MLKKTRINLFYCISSLCIAYFCFLFVFASPSLANIEEGDTLLNQGSETAEVSSIYQDEIHSTSIHHNPLRIISDNMEQTNNIYISRDEISESHIKLAITSKDTYVTIEDNYRSKNIRINFQSKNNLAMSLTELIQVSNNGKYESFEIGDSLANDEVLCFFNSEGMDTKSVFSENLNHVYSEKRLLDEYNGAISAFRLKINHLDNIVNYELTVQLDKVYAPQIYDDNSNIYISFKAPSEVYDNIIVVDAGHGGKDSGAIGVKDYYLEKNLNLIIVEKMKRILEKENIKVYYTRVDDNTLYLLPRVSLANELGADLFLSIHYNASEYESASGSEVLYNEKDSGIFSSYHFAKNCLDEIFKVTKNLNRGLVEASQILIVGKSEVPIALVEIGFISNKRELAFITKSSTQDAISLGLVKAIKKSLQEMNN